MDKIQPAPRSALIGGAADALLGAQRFGNRVQIPEGVPLIGGYGLGDLLGAMPAEVDNWSYGDLPMTTDPGVTGSRVPRMKTGRSDGVADVLSALPVGGLIGKGGGQALRSAVPSTTGRALRHSQDGALNPSAIAALEQLIDRFMDGSRRSETIRNAIDLTPQQQADLRSVLTERWGKPYDVPASLPLKPLHGFESRVEKQGFTPEELRNWYVSAAADEARVSTAHRSGQPALTNRYFDATRGTEYDVNLPIVSDALGNIYGNGVIPKGVFGPKK